MASIAAGRLAQERKMWRKDHPIGFYAKPATNVDGTLNLFKWVCAIPGRKNTIWEGGLYKIIPNRLRRVLSFPQSSIPTFFSDGEICLSILEEERDWKPTMGIMEILLGIRDLLDEPNTASPANGVAATEFDNDRPQYEDRVRREAIKFNVQAVQKSL